MDKVVEEEEVKVVEMDLDMDLIMFKAGELLEVAMAMVVTAAIAEGKMVKIDLVMGLNIVLAMIKLEGLLLEAMHRVNGEGEVVAQVMA
ncbi:hypothetical protein ABZP36_033890 [Zizania latifolia]